MKFIQGIAFLLLAGLVTAYAAESKHIEGNDVRKTYFDLFDVEDNLSGLIAFHDSRDDARYPANGNYFETTLSVVPE